MKIRNIAVAALSVMLAAAPLQAQEESKGQIKLYGFIRNYFTYDSRENVSGTEDLFMYLPKDQKMVDGVDLNEVGSFRFASLTSRVGLDATGYRFGGWNMGAKIEADFYAGVTGVTGTAQLRMRQAYMTIGKEDLSFKVGQAWHPFAADMPDVVSLNSGAPFNPFSRTPMVLVDWKFADAFSLTGAALWQMQYASAGPSGQSANYIKYGCTPELYLGLNYSNDGFLARVGVDMLSIKPRNFDADGLKKVNDRITTVSPYVYLQYSGENFKVKAKSVYASAGEHMNLNGGYAVSAVNADGSWEYTPTRNSSSWVSILYGKKLQGMLFAGYVKNFGTAKEIVDLEHLYFSKNSFANMNSMFRLSPTLIYNFGKLTLALEYELTGVEYGSWVNDTASFAIASGDLHHVLNHRVQVMTKFTF